MDINTERLNEFVGKMLGDLGGAASVPMVRIGDTLGLYKTLHSGGPMTAAELAARTRVHEYGGGAWWVHAGVVFFTSTQGGGAAETGPELVAGYGNGYGQVWAYDPAAMTLSTDFDTHKADVANVIPPQRAGAVAQAAGLHVSRVDGSPLVYNCADPYLPDLLICRMELAARVLGLVKALPPA